MIRFLLGHADKSVSSLDPAATVLDYLRETEHLTGTKEGCGTGDCGACTVVLGEDEGGSMRYRAANACIMPLASLHGKQLIAVEHLKHDGHMHPVQQAMVDCHGSQCGFCTPGIVMSMFAHLKSRQQTDRDGLIEALSGNLCRCTGYQPIIEAGLKACTDLEDDQFTEVETATIERLQSIADDPNELEFENNGRHVHLPRSIAELASLLVQFPEAVLLAGGTDLMPGINRQGGGPRRVICTGGVKELGEVETTISSLEIGAAVTYSDCIQLLVEQYPGLQGLFARFGSRPIRNLATLAGNIASASPVGDMLPFLIVAGAELVLRRGEARHTVAVESFLTGYRKTALRAGEFIERIIIPRAKPGYLLKVYKVSKRLEDDTSSTCAAFHIRLEQGIVRDAGIAYGGMAEMPQRASHCESALVGKPWIETTITGAMEALERDFTPISDYRASAEYRVQVSRNLLLRLFHESQTPSVGTGMASHG